MEIPRCQEIHESTLVSEHRLFYTNPFIYRFDFFPPIHSVLCHSYQERETKEEGERLFFLFPMYFSHLRPLHVESWKHLKMDH